MNMKNRIITKSLLGFLVLVGLTVACAKDEMGGTSSQENVSEVSFSAITEQSSPTRTSLNIGDVSAQVFWSENDAIRVWSESASSDFTATLQDIDNDRATFTGVAPEGTLISAIYPATLSSAHNKVVFEQEQIYKADNISEGSMPMYGVVNNSEDQIQFKNLAGVVHLQLKGNDLVESILLSSPDFITGEAIIEYNGGEPTTNFLSGGNTITLNCAGELGGGVQLNPDKATSFYIVVPATDARTFTVVVNPTSQSMVSVAPENTLNQITRSKIINMPDLEFEPAYSFNYEYVEGTQNLRVLSLADTSLEETSDIIIPGKVFYDGAVRTITHIGSQAFQDAKFTGNLILSEGLTTIGYMAFSGSKFTGNLIIPEGVTSISRSAFSSCVNFNGNLKLPESLTSLGDNAFVDCAGFMGELVIPKNITEISESTFSGCSGFDSLVLPAGLKTINNFAFYGCNGFKGSLNLPESLTNIEISAFTECSGFSGKLSIPNDITTIKNSTFRDCSGFESLTLHDNITHIGENAFSGAVNLGGELTLPKNLISIGGSAFSSTSFSGNLVLPESLTSIGVAAFYGCSGFTGSLTIPPAIAVIEDAAVFGCSGLNGLLTIPTSVTRIGNSSFYENSYTAVTSLAEIAPEIDPTAFSHYITPNPMSVIVVTVPTSSVTSYENNTGWSSQFAGFTAIID